MPGPTHTPWPHAAAPTPWPHAAAPTDADLDALLRREGLTPRWWSNAPGDTYAAHSHPYHKVLYCLSGSITFETPDGPLRLALGDRLDIPPGTSHSATVGPRGVACVEAPRPSG